MLTCLATALLVLVQEQSPPPRPADGVHEPAPSERRVEITSLANAGFLLHSGKFTVMIDGFLKDPYKEYEALPSGTYQEMVAGGGPFGGYVLALVSHNHPDHFQPLVAERFLRGNPDSALISSPQVVESMRSGAQVFREIRKQVSEIALKKGESKIFAHEEMSVEMMLLAHGGERNRGIVQNYGHLITMGGSKILHIGDADLDPSVFSPYRFAERDIDVALIPYWFFTSEVGIKILDEEIRAKSVVACHIPAAEKELFIERMKIENPLVRIFAQPMESLVFDASPEAKDGASEE